VGYAYHHQGKQARAIACYRRALPLLQAHGVRYFEADALSHLGDAHHAAGDRAAGRAAWSRALDIFTDLDHPDAEAVRSKLLDL
jgi:tetratricopeptide (TPR) repeat protein